MGPALFLTLIIKIMKPIHYKPNLYALYFETIKEIGLKYGYNIVLHGSLNRDLDLIAIPWEEAIGDAQEMVNEICFMLGGAIMRQNRSVHNIEGEMYSIKPHGRINYIINLNRDIKYKYDGTKTILLEYSDPQYYIDLSLILAK